MILRARLSQFVAQFAESFGISRFQFRSEIREDKKQKVYDSRRIYTYHKYIINSECIKNAEIHARCVSRRSDSINKEATHLSCRIDANSLQKSPPCFTYLRTSSNPPCPPCNQKPDINFSLFFLLSKLKARNQSSLYA